jgi:tripartite-type tricarboxylate transporter receptor subunit TctC
MRIRRLLLFALACPPFALAQSWPTQPVRVMVGFPPGGTTDVIGRLVANELSEQLGKPFVVENRGGASGTIGAGVVAKSAPDGHSLILVPSTHGTARALYASLPYEESDSRRHRPDREHTLCIRRPPRLPGEELRLAGWFGCV